ncbi:MAG: pyruvate ferredoxin oxidoreductase [Candidatus Schekmanbacteria bacterium RIFCSPHIGHO2_02_FULL_38_11]|uniref:Pyruvate ferredoxin oxidoreductase n=1 Tax=Candidatus Schekmanbacteria bacterium RIFCSPLOWO2_12_FULL_38_15 TaxID=1817883 RepID=A0A1F7SNY1_9BACT|nr:MAG: pyruvate ferredoxin oxidoreductase [Candidatus Schekmanbacteria bacterium GWA2_38_9]OGL50304.1 MAG: pyruvate ferredoxin oxidoreductase [Candidatus Schekmanbacteria bacterium RIFCSPLOWO2_02_FULL_38_14]OGL51856.1 MAG: pyruvate ferredoxin oxidoreductase [Candidatus Schekmanbacteria bacterium RIFCSPHIGHO2_02_FULL_38_11]OGL55495.1 MAG: pyruvate ferredoxin oxidoreductase [Candidatus Schekmanbacteria bacterium RIFCSPLOWO2_12_FULL_38_15]
MVKKLIMGNHAVSFGVMLSRVDVIAAYPITPQTQVVELLSEMCADKKINTRFLKVESEHSAMASCIGASTAGARTFTATSSQGLLLMHELLHWAAGARLPIVMANVNRALGPAWNIWTEETDSLAQRDTGWIQMYCESNQEILDTVFQAYKIAEKTLLPLMLAYDGFYLSHTLEPVDIPDQKTVDSFLPGYEPQIKVDVDNPNAFGSIAYPEHYMEMRYLIKKAMDGVRDVAVKVNDEFRDIFKRGYGIIEKYKTEDARVLLITTGTAASTTRIVIDNLRKRGNKIGMIRIKMFRPFPSQEIRDAVRGYDKIAVIDRNMSFGVGGIFAQEIRAALSGYSNMPVVFEFIAGLGGRDITPNTIEEITKYTLNHERGEEGGIWAGLKI